ncbi:helix-turn-helix domain-containing protein [Puniceicoccales bacterium CK1056]|uniref:Helix-turn-helix domain-containing protein n=1 Tax=Oceanipulchritudo coccoides TaxID=2706888 RepID=A0A6B2M0Y8_9BACT|nr:helix-turn-helix domain-containing protein [Oceanipulchritudo coccoides]NDV61707.1 helix-turn-helix domain-containing protein [Oceanipulchritudo coccoides]
MAENSSVSALSGMFDFSILREIRKREGLTLDEVASRSGLSIAVISRIERNQTSAELETLYKLGRVFGMSATDLLALTESRMAHRKVEDSYQSDGFQFRVVRYANHSCFLGEAKAGARIRKPEIHHDDHETCWVIEGRLRVELPHETVELGAGESLQFDAIQEHSYEAVEDSRLILVHVKKRKRY